MVKKIVLVNPKGGSGKTTLAVNLAACYAASGRRVALLDLDPQGSSTRWLAKRPDSSQSIHGIAGFNIPTGVTRSFAMAIPPEIERVVVDTPAGLIDQQLPEVTRGADRILVPVLPSAIDIHAAARCIADLLLKANINRTDNRLAIVANRVKPNTVVFRSLMRFLDSLDIPVVAVLRDTQNYIRSAEMGLGLHEMQRTRVEPDLVQWEPLIDWLENGNVQPSNSLSASRGTPEVPSNVTWLETERGRRGARPRR